MNDRTPSSKADSDSSIESFYSTTSHRQPTNTSSVRVRSAGPPPNPVNDDSHEPRDNVDAVQATKHAVLTAFSSTSSKTSHVNTLTPCPCPEPLRYCQCHGTAYIRLCSNCPGTDCNICLGVGVVPAFPVQPGVDMTEILERRGAPPGLDTAHDRSPPPAVTDALGDACNSRPRSQPRRPSLRDIVLGREWRQQTQPAPHSTPEGLQYHQHQPYYIRTPEDLTLVLDGPRPSDFELDLPSISFLQPQLSPLLFDTTNSASIPQQGWDGLNSLLEHERYLAGLSLGISNLSLQQLLTEPDAAVTRGGGRGDWLTEVDDNGPIPDEYRPGIAGESVGGERIDSRRNRLRGSLRSFWGAK